MKGIGIDVIEISRIQKAVDSLGQPFLDRIFTPFEQAYCSRRKRNRYPELAARFAAKEAYSKAVGTGLRGLGRPPVPGRKPRMDFKDIEVKNDPLGKPEIYVKGRKVSKALVSLTHNVDTAIAVVVIS